MRAKYTTLAPWSHDRTGHPGNSTGVETGEEEEEEEAKIMALSPKESDERGVTEARLARVMGGQEDSVMGEET